MFGTPPPLLVQILRLRLLSRGGLFPALARACVASERVLPVVLFYRLHEVQVPGAGCGVWGLVLQAQRLLYHST